MRCVLIALTVSGSVAAGQNVFGQNAATAERDYSNTVKQAKLDYEKRELEARKKLIASLKQAQEQATKGGKLDEALRLRKRRRDLEKLPQVVKPVKAVKRKIPKTALRFKGHRYHIFFGKLSWHEAKRKCELMGGHLCCINSKDEQEFIAKWISRRKEIVLWIGGTDEEEEGKWKWVDGTAIDKQFWNAKQPDGQLGYGDYIVIQNVKGYPSGTWNDFHASGLWLTKQFVHGYICEWD